MQRTAVKCIGLWGLALLALVTLSGAQAAEPFVVYFPDSNLAAAVRTALGVLPGDPILDTALLRLKTLNAASRSVTQLDGLEFCTNLTQLQIQDNQISDISQLTGLTKLVDLYLWSNKVTDITPLRNLRNLRFVFLQDNEIQDISALGENTGISSGDVLNLSGNFINQDGLCNTVPALRARGVTVYVTYECGTIVVNIPDPNLELRVRRALNKLTGDIHDTDMLRLASLDASDASIRTITGLEYAVNLVQLNLSGNRISDIAPLSDLNRLTKLQLGNNAISDITPLTRSYGLVYLELQSQHTDDGTRILSNLDGLQFLGGLTFLYLHDNKISDIGKLTWLLNIQGLTLGSNEITDISILDGFEKITSLDAGGNHIADITPVARLRALTYLGLWNNNITNIDRLANLTNLTTLDLSGNKIQNVSILVGLTNLINLYLHDNGKISNITALAGLPNLAVVTLQNNSLSDISPIVANTGIGTLSAQQIAVGQKDSVDVRGNQLSQESLCNDVPALIARDVILQYDGHCCTESFLLTTQVQGNGTVDPTEGVHRFCEGATVPVTAEGIGTSVFDHWEGDVTGSQNPVSVVMDRNVTVTAVFRDTNVSYTLTLGVSGTGVEGTVSATGSNPYPSRAQVTITATANAGWIFDHWTGDFTGRENPATLTMDDNKTINAVFVREPTRFTLTTAVQGNGTIDPPAGPHQYPEGTAVIVKAIPAAGWAFDHWEGDLSGSANPNAIGMTSDMSVIAVFKQMKTLTVSVVGNGTVDPAVGSHEYAQDTQVILRAMPDLGWVFDHWEGAATGTANPTAITMTADADVTAVFTEDVFDFSLAMVTEGVGTTLPLPGFHRYHRDDVVTASAFPADGWVFDHWAGDLNGEQNPISFTMNTNKTAIAVFLSAPISFVLTTAVQPPDAGTISPAAGLRRYAEGKQVTIVANASLGWIFDHWEGDLGGSAPQGLVTMSADKSVTAVFRKFPVITAVSPDRGSLNGGEPVTIFGLQLTTATSVLFGTKAAIIESISDSALNVRTPAGPNPRGAVDVVVNTAIGTAVKLAGYTFREPPGPPEIGAVLPSRGSAEGGDVVLIRGYNLATATSVTFGGIPALIAASEDTRLYVATLPHLPGIVEIVVTSPSGSATLPNAFTYLLRPRILAIVPNQGTATGGETVSVVGVGLGNPAQVLFGDTPATVISSTDTQIDVTTPPNPGGVVDVTVINPGGTVTLAGAFDYFTGAATLACHVVDAATQSAILNATVRIETLDRTAVSGGDGNYTFTNLRPGTYIVTVSASTYAIALRTVTLQVSDNALEEFGLKPVVASPTDCGSLFKRLDASVAEITLPLSVQEAPSGTVAPTSRLAIRLTADAAIDPASVWAILETRTDSVTGGAWRAALPGDDRDGWVVFVPTNPMPAGETVTLTVGAVTANGAVLGPVSYDFAVEAGQQANADVPAVEEATGVPALPDVLAVAKSPTYRIGPAGVFPQPVTIHVPVPAGSDANALEIYYYSEAASHTGWYRGTAVTGWLIPDSRRVVEAGAETYIEVQVNHSGVIQLAQAPKALLGSAVPLDLGVSGSRIRWIALAAILAVLAIALRRSVRHTGYQ